MDKYIPDNNGYYLVQVISEQQREIQYLKNQIALLSDKLGYRSRHSVDLERFDTWARHNMVDENGYIDAYGKLETAFMAGVTYARSSK